MTVPRASANGATSVPPKKVLIVGGVAGGASAGARLRRLSEDVEITLFERGPYVSFANCGLPYAVSEVINDEAKLLVATPKKFKEWFNIDVQQMTEVTAIHRDSKTISIKNLATGEEREVPYDALLLAPGSAALKPPIPGIDLPGLFTMKTIPDMRLVKEWIKAKGVKSAVIVGGGFIGLEMAENLHHMGISVKIVEMLTQVMPPMDAEMIEPLHAHMRSKGVELALGDGVAGFEQRPGGGLTVKTASGAAHDADLVILAIGVRPETKLAKDAGLKLGKRGGIRVDDGMRTSDPSIYAVGDAVEVKDWVTGEHTLIPLAGPANRQGRIAANVMMGMEPGRFRGVQGTAVVGVMGMTLAQTGASEKTLKRVGIPYQKVYTHANNHAGYYPGAGAVDIKLLFSPADGKILGAQAVGTVEGVEKRIDVVSMALQFGASVYDLEEAELCYAPQYGSAKDAVNFTGMVAANFLRGDMPLANWDEDLDSIRADANNLIVDVRETGEFAKGAIEGAVNMPLSTLRENVGKLPKDKKLYVYCQVGMRGYLATRQMLLADLNAVNVSGGFRSWQTQFKPIVAGKL
ncbi:hypothetical protein FOA52_012071 [Chlamydomonas sp. UWO 241]|nr:hypothetical protein FOA52_012071 [Chlamydomonas sp. UWO 241]